ncbi:hypothetical protein [Paenibacillus sp. KN14-4R]|uniref:hypothetical protein n=1 Tax=Paenibacillus sp. KN14-4R TaxID=3445773 RepID=UPI003FA17F48
MTLGLKRINYLGYATGIFSIILWIILVYVNPFSPVEMSRSSMNITLTMLALPACLFIIGINRSRSSILLIAFIWSFPYSLYMLRTPGIFLLFGVTSLMYLICFILFRLHKVRY